MATTVDVPTYLHAQSEGSDSPVVNPGESVCKSMCLKYRPDGSIPGPRDPNRNYCHDLQGYKRYQRVAKVRSKRAYERWYYSHEGPGGGSNSPISIYGMGPEGGEVTPSGLPIAPGRTELEMFEIRFRSPQFSDPNFEQNLRNRYYWQREVYFMDCIDEIEEAYEGENICCACIVEEIEACIEERCRQECDYNFSRCEGSCGN